MVEVQEFFKFSNPLFLDAFVASVLYTVYRLLTRKFPRIAEGIKEASLLFLVFMCYDASRYFALDEASTAIGNARKVIAFEKLTHINVEVPMQKFAVAHEQFAKFINSFYLGAHWGGLVIFFVWAYARVIFAAPRNMERRRKLYTVARGRFIIMNMIAATSFIAFPCAPPRVIPDEGYVDTLLTVSHADVYKNTRRFVNPYAAMPSMHQGYSLLFALSICLMLRSEILSWYNNPDEDEFDLESGKLNNDTKSPSRMRALFNEALRKYNNYHILSEQTCRSKTKIFYLSLLPILFLTYPVFMFVVIVSTGNHFVLDALAGASAMVLAALIFPLVMKAIEFVQGPVMTRAQGLLRKVSGKVVLGEKDVEMEEKKEAKEEEKKHFLQEYHAAETA